MPISFSFSYPKNVQKTENKGTLCNHLSQQTLWISQKETWMNQKENRPLEKDS